MPLAIGIRPGGFSVRGWSGVSPEGGSRLDRQEGSEPLDRPPSSEAGYRSPRMNR